MAGSDRTIALVLLFRTVTVGGVRSVNGPAGRMICEGITEISSDDIAFAKEFGYTIKLLAIAKRSGEGMEARVQPTLLPNSHILANVSGSFNAILMRGELEKPAP